MVRSGDIRRARICQWPTYKEAELRRLRSEKWLLLYGDHPEEPAEQLKEVKDEMEAAKPVFSYLQPLGPPKQTEGQKGEGAVPSPSQQSCVGGGLGGDPSGEGHARGRGKGGKGKGKGKDGEHVRTRGRGGRGGRGKGRSMSATCEVVDGLCPPPVGVGEGGSTGVVGMDLDGHAHAEPPPLPSAPLSPSRASVLPHSPGGPPPFPAAAASSALPPSSLSRQVEKEKGRGGKGASQSGSRVSLASPFPVSSSKENTKEKKSAEPGRGPEDLSSSGVALLGWQCPYERDICAYPRWTEEEYAHWHDEQVRQFGEHPSLRVCGGGKKAARVRLRAQPVEALVERVLELEETESELRQMKARRVVQDAECSKLREQTDELRLEVSRYRDLVSCVICRDRRRVAVLQPCQHFAFCSECTKGLRVCPLCRTHITKTLNLRVDDLNA
uniref:RING-type domain-containing protein n=1 Tax=Chromera velia CCMP2878 TaxID=1169474 RepID=A0A0G4I769_9ALVE|eukprot:Cvel_11517.t1-p1 / transcript=Cvel_11517.t1 / gene=Cvel_11517 / organism=Chromera_velia_CCMP2878 / gene_product=hypothetical protein / transcript_product=hypothetical protein / location=Cvel_scaffold726:22871-24190(-) / protein_length=440 / sequence_SO=supercontig / SO=protein_coding / is_pseudo=false